MANPDRPYGFKTFTPRHDGAGIRKASVAAATTFAIGDPLKWTASANLAVAAITDRNIIGVSATTVAAGVPATAAYYPAESWQFQVQDQGTYVETTHRLLDVDMAGSTGAFELNSANTDVQAFKILGYVGTPDNLPGIVNTQVYGVFTNPQSRGGRRYEEDLRIWKCQMRPTLGSAGTVTLHGATVPVTGTVTDVILTSDTTTTDTAGQKWVISPADGAGNAMCSVGWDTDPAAQGNFTAHTPQSIMAVCDQNLTVTEGDQIALVMTETGAAEDLSGAYVSLIIVIRATA